MPTASVTHVRSLLVGQRSVPGLHNRARSIIRDVRPSFVLEADRLPDALSADAFEIDAQDFERFRAVTETAAGSVGQIQVRHDDRWVSVGSCFRVSTDGRRVATARHLVRGLLAVDRGFPTGLRPEPLEAPAGTYREARVHFESGEPHDSDDAWFAVEAIEWMHARWDLMLLRLDRDTGRSPLIPVSPTAAPDRDRVGLCVLGFPEVAPGGSSDAFEQVFVGALGTKRAAYGKRFRGHADIEEGVLRHDASTLPGNSGSPVLSLATTEVIGLHYFGGDLVDPNRAVDLPHALAEPALDACMRSGEDPYALEAFEWPGQTTRRFGQALDVLRLGAEELALDLRADAATEIGVLRDRFDERDRLYRPSLVVASDRLLPPKLPPGTIARQSDPFSCTGFALAAAIEHQLMQSRPDGEIVRVSPTMLYALATRHDEYIDDRPGGSTLRGVLKGFYHFGVCRLETAPYHGYDPHWHLSLDAAREARRITLGAYSRLQPILSDYQLAIQETGAVLVSARLHRGWRRGARRIGRIRFDAEPLGAHAFVLVGYDAEGFVVRNSWGDDWAQWKGRPGHAHWRYEDWAENVIDGWAIRLAPSTPDAFDLRGRDRGRIDGSDTTGLHPRIARLRDPRRVALLGHLVYAERDRVAEARHLGIGIPSLRETAIRLASREASERYPALALIFHDPTFATDALVRLVAHLTRPFKLNGIYPIHVIYGQDEMRFLTLRLQHEAESAVSRAGGCTTGLDAFIERRAKAIAASLLGHWQTGVVRTLCAGGGLRTALAALGLDRLSYRDCGTRRHVHIVAFGAGWCPARRLLERTDAVGIETVRSLARIAPVLATASLPTTIERTRDWYLDAERARDVALQGYGGDWCDLFATVDASRITRPRHVDGVGAGPDLASAVTSPVVLNDVLRLMLERRPPRTRRFRTDRPA